MPEPTPGQTVGPFFHDALPYDGGRELVAPATPGAVRLHGTVRDGHGDPVPDALLELRQADAAGRVPRVEGSLAPRRPVHRLGPGGDRCGWALPLHDGRTRRDRRWCGVLRAHRVRPRPHRPAVHPGVPAGGARRLPRRAARGGAAHACRSCAPTTGRWSSTSGCRARARRSSCGSRGTRRDRAARSRLPPRRRPGRRRGPGRRDAAGRDGVGAGAGRGRAGRRRGGRRGRACGRRPPSRPRLAARRRRARRQPRGPAGRPGCATPPSPRVAIPSPCTAGSPARTCSTPPSCCSPGTRCAGSATT